MPLCDITKEIVDTWTNAINQERELTREEKIYIMKIQDDYIQTQLEIDDGLTDEELEAEYYSNHRLDLFRSKCK